MTFLRSAFLPTLSAQTALRSASSCLPGDSRTGLKARQRDNLKQAGYIRAAALMCFLFHISLTSKKWSLRSRKLSASIKKAPLIPSMGRKTLLPRYHPYSLFRAPFSRKTACSLTRKTAELTFFQPCGSGTTFFGGLTDARTLRALSLHQPTDTPALHRHLDLL